MDQSCSQVRPTTPTHVIGAPSPPVPDAREKNPTKWCHGVDDDGHVNHHDKDTDSLESAYKRTCIVERDELKEYLNALPATHDTKTLQWWKANAGAYPCLAAMDRDYLAIPATSAPAACVCVTARI